MSSEVLMKEVLINLMHVCTFCMVNRYGTTCRGQCKIILTVSDINRNGEEERGQLTDAVQFNSIWRK